MSRSLETAGARGQNTRSTVLWETTSKNSIKGTKITEKSSKPELLNTQERNAFFLGDWLCHNRQGGFVA